MEELRFMGLLPKIESDEFQGLKVQSNNSQLPNVYIEPLHGEGPSKILRIYQEKGDNTIPQSLDISDIIKNVGTLFDSGYDKAICRMVTEQIVYLKKAKGISIQTEIIKNDVSKSGKSIDIDYLIESPKIRGLLLELGILSEGGLVRQQQINKLVQVKNFIAAIYEVLPRFREHKMLNIVDAACGKSYLSFVLSYFFREEWGYNANFQGIDTNERLINRCEEIRDNLSFSQMEFFTSSIGQFSTNRKIDILYSLHGCNTATDEAIAAGIRLNSDVIIVVPCCHFELRSQLRDHPLKGITKFGLFEDRFATLLTDSLRALALEAAGYDVSSFRFVTDDVSPKNTLLRAQKTGNLNSHALQEYYGLKNMFNVSPTIEKLLPMIFKNENVKNIENKYHPKNLG